MDQKPPRQARPHQLAAGLKLVPLELVDADDIVEIATQSFPVVWSKDDFAHFLTHQSGLCLGIASESPRKVHSYFLALLAQGDVDVISIATHPEKRGQGLGTTLLRHVFDAAHVARVFLEVDVNNTSAISLYRKLGFATLGVRKKYYAQKTDALVMRWSK